MPPNTTKKKKTVFKIRAPKLFKVTLKLSFDQKYQSSEDLEKEEDEDGNEETNTEFCKRIQDWDKTDVLYGTTKQLEEFVKREDALEYVRYMPDGDVLSAKWNNDFSISFVFKPAENTTIEKTKKWFEEYSLADGEYESSDSNGWTIKTVGGLMEYGLVDYRENPILVEEVSSSVLTGGRRKTRRNYRK